MKTPKYDFKKIEKKWRAIWRAKKLYEPKLKTAKDPFYNLMMFPYPSAEGLHVGNMYAFAGTDIYGRYMRMQGKAVFEPIGLDGFGIHSENYALKIGTHPMKQSKISEKRFYKQLEDIGNGFAWEERLETYDPEYYKWTQWLFAEMFRRGLAYRKKQAVNWCPSCKTVLADEQVVDGKCERCGTPAVKRDLEQWFFGITKYADRLLNNLDKIDWSEKVKIAQRNWIGKSEGSEIDFPIAGTEHKIKVFTTRADTLFGATYMVLAPEHTIIKELAAKVQNLEEVKKYIAQARAKSDAERIAEVGEKTGVELKGIIALNPATGKNVPVWVADYVLSGYGTGAIMAVPAHDERDFEFAKKFGLPIKIVIRPEGGESEGGKLTKAYIGEGRLIGSGQLDGLPIEKAAEEITKLVGGKRKTQFRLRDWLISRQRYWGAPIPMIHCAACEAKGMGEREDMPGWYAVPTKDLPVKLPNLKEFRPTGTDRSPLATAKSFYETKCPKCGGKARRETDVSDTFLDSAWYYLRYPSTRSARSGQVPWDPQITKKWLPVDMYIGGAEHSVLHLLYVRFVAMALKDWGLLDFEEPFKKFRAHGLLIKEGAKMSKSKGNVVNPDEYIARFGADTLRMYLMFLAPFEQGGDFRDQGVVGVARFLERVWRMDAQMKNTKRPKENVDLARPLHQTINKITEDIAALRYNTAVSAAMILLNEFEKSPDKLPVAYWTQFLQLIAPFAPFITEELWQAAGGRGSIHVSKWPQAEEKYLKSDTYELVIQVNGRLRDTVLVPADISQEEALRIALERDKIKVYVTGSPKKVIFVPKRLINLVV